MTSNSRKLRNMLASDETYIVPGVYDALTARMCQHVGFEAVWISGYMVSGSRLAKPDVGLLTFNEMLDTAAAVCDVVDIPVVVDGETGYGGILNLQRTVKAFECAGAAGMQLDDIVLETCPYIGREYSIVSIEEMVNKISAAKEAATDPDFCILATCCIFQPEKRDEIIERAKAYYEAGSDAIFFPWEKVEDLEWFTQAAGHIGAPMIAIFAPSLPHQKIEDYNRLGYRIVIYATDLLYVSVQAQLKLLKELKKTGTGAALKGDLAGHSEYLDLVQMPKILEIEKKYQVS